MRCSAFGVNPALVLFRYVSWWEDRLLTIEKLRALGITFLHLFTLVCCCLHVAVGHGIHSSSRFHQEFTHLHIITRSGTVQGSPKVEKEMFYFVVFELRVRAFHKHFFHSPPVAVSGIRVHSKLHQELNDFCMSSTYSIVQGSDALIIGQTGVVHLDIINRHVSDLCIIH